MRYLFFINPAAGKGKVQKKLFSRIEDAFKNRNEEYKIIVTRFAGDAEQIARKEALKGDKIRMYACGGEGTTFELLNAIYGFQNVELGCIPCGSANDFLKLFGDTSPFFDIEAQIDAESQPIDIIKAGERYCINGCSIGMDAMVGRDMKLFKRIPLVSGPLAYKLAIAKTFLNLHIGVKINIKIDNEPSFDTDCLFAVVANGPFYGGGYTGAPYANPADNILDFTLVETVSHLKVLKFLPFYEKGEFEQFDFCHLKRCKKMSFESNKAIPVQLDGEIIEVNALDISIIENGIKFIIPKGASLENRVNADKILNFV